MYTRDIQCGKIPRDSEGPGCCSWEEWVETGWESRFRVIHLEGEGCRHPGEETGKRQAPGWVYSGAAWCCAHV